MLIAWVRGKRRSKIEYEDEILSAVFGALVCASPAQRAAVFHAIAQACGATIDGSSSCTMTFWPNLAKVHRVEPDLLVEFSDGSVLMIEAKWDSGQSEDQLARQWIEADAAYPGRVWHIYLTKEAHTLSQMLGETVRDERHGLRLRSLTWSRLAHVAGFARDGLEQWGAQVRHFLESLGQAPFVGVGDAYRRRVGLSKRFKRTWRFQPSIFRVAESLLVRTGSVPFWRAKGWTFHRRGHE